MSYDHVFFDLDGTLTDPEEGITTSLRLALEQMGVTAPPQAEMRTFIGPPIQVTLAGRFGMSPADVARCYGLYRERYDRVGWSENTPYPGMVTLLSDLRDRGAVLATATSKPEPSALKILERFGMLQYFAVVGTASADGVTRATKAAVLRDAIQRVGGQGSAVLVGDRMHDFEGAAECGIDSLAVPWGFGTPEEHSQATAQARDLADLRHKLGV